MGRHDALALPSGAAMETRLFCLSPASLLKVCLEIRAAPLLWSQALYHQDELLDVSCWGEKASISKLEFSPLNLTLPEQLRQIVGAQVTPQGGQLP